MAIDKAVDSTVLDGMFTDIANAIREKNGETVQYTPSEMPAAIASISSGMKTTRGTVTGSQTVQTIYTGLSTITYFLIYAVAQGSGYGVDMLIYDADNNAFRSYNHAGDYIPSAGRNQVSGGYITIGYSNSQYTMLKNNTTFRWIAVGS